MLLTLWPASPLPEICLSTQGGIQFPSNTSLLFLHGGRCPHYLQGNSVLLHVPLHLAADACCGRGQCRWQADLVYVGCLGCHLLVAPFGQTLESPWVGHASRWPVHPWPFPIVRKDTKSDWLIAKETLTLADPRGEACSLFELSILSFSWSTEATLQPTC